MNKDIVLRYFRDPPEIVTPRLLLRRMKKTDYRDMYEYACDPCVTKFLTWLPHTSPAYTMRYLAYVATRYRAGEFYDWAVVFREDLLVMRAHIRSGIGAVGMLLGIEVHKREEILKLQKLLPS